jgi:hypothetical protein
VGSDAGRRAERRLDRALLDRLPKLDASRRELGVVGILLCLGVPDWQLSSPWGLLELLMAWTGPGPSPDHITIVMHDPAGSLGLAACLRVNGNWAANLALVLPPGALAWHAVPLRKEDTDVLRTERRRRTNGGSWP